jgi:hypothetical protein
MSNANVLQAVSKVETATTDLESLAGAACDELERQVVQVMNAGFAAGAVRSWADDLKDEIDQCDADVPNAVEEAVDNLQAAAGAAEEAVNEWLQNLEAERQEAEDALEAIVTKK